ncbi:MAG: hypothetical protein U9Q21_03200, partial [Candidatus Auribacterota bacterium]|nr:hypothetical protein [Candidatus Auribacterota bacterium]
KATADDGSTYTEIDGKLYLNLDFDGGKMGWAASVINSLQPWEGGMEAMDRQMEVAVKRREDNPDTKEDESNPLKVQHSKQRELQLNIIGTAEGGLKLYSQTDNILQIIGNGSFYVDEYGKVSIARGTPFRTKTEGSVLGWAEKEKGLFNLAGGLIGQSEEQREQTRMTTMLRSGIAGENNELSSLLGRQETSEFYSNGKNFYRNVAGQTITGGESGLGAEAMGLPGSGEDYSLGKGVEVLPIYDEDAYGFKISDNDRLVYIGKGEEGADEDGYKIKKASPMIYDEFVRGKNKKGIETLANSFLLGEGEMWVPGRLSLSSKGGGKKSSKEASPAASCFAGIGDGLGTGLIVHTDEERVGELNEKTQKENPEVRAYLEKMMGKPMKVPFSLGAFNEEGEKVFTGLPKLALNLPGNVMFFDKDANSEHPQLLIPFYREVASGDNTEANKDDGVGTVLIKKVLEKKKSVRAGTYISEVGGLGNIVAEGGLAGIAWMPGREEVFFGAGNFLKMVDPGGGYGFRTAEDRGSKSDPGINPVNSIYEYFYEGPFGLSPEGTGEFVALDGSKISSTKISAEKEVGADGTIIFKAAYGKDGKMKAAYSEKAVNVCAAKKILPHDRMVWNSLKNEVEQLVIKEDGTHSFETVNQEELKSLSPEQIKEIERQKKQNEHAVYRSRKFGAFVLTLFGIGETQWKAEAKEVEKQVYVAQCQKIVNKIEEEADKEK